jgi:hypothetical protein
MSYTFTPGTGSTAAADQVGSASAPATNQIIPYAKLDQGAAGASSPVTATNPLATQGGGAQTGTVASGSGNTVVKGSAGRLCRVLVTTAGTGSGNVLIYDNASTNSGTVIGVVPATVAIGTYYSLDLPAANGIVVANVANGPALTVSYN